MISTHSPPLKTLHDNETLSTKKLNLSSYSKESVVTEQPASTPSVFVRRSVVPAAVSQTTAKYWEDLDPEGSHNHVNLSCQGILMPERDLEFKRKLNKDQQSLWRHPTQELSYKYFRK